MIDWVSHDGWSDPNIPGETLVDVLFRDGDVGRGVMHDWDQNWQWAYLDDDHDGDIVAYKIVSETQAERDARMRGNE